MNTATLSLWYGMDYEPEQGEYIGMTPGIPWTNYMLPDPRYVDPRDYHTLVYVYDNTGNQLVKPDETTVGHIPRDNYLTEYLRMLINVVWVEVDKQYDLDPLVHDSTNDSLATLVKRARIFGD